MSGSKTVPRPPKKRGHSVIEQPTQGRTEACGETIREAAYFKWEAAGRPCGDGVEFWLAAEAEVKMATQDETPADAQP